MPRQRKNAESSASAAVDSNNRQKSDLMVWPAQALFEAGQQSAPPVWFRLRRALAQAASTARGAQRRTASRSSPSMMPATALPGSELGGHADEDAPAERIVDLRVRIAT